ncbi:hydrogenase nickel incorporation protein HypB [Desulfohalobiaceae bacterium Ax17]|jgi:hydrogenase nickel incorporation protein HypB|uniref:hydrogenase nickel incorporation protein HypB n=1 Tax=Desulfovulcanus ferrireducens TaxID=2831190 RepID=UPI00207B9B20|nr:hydrogenase nickel incorporation protein HypB [Desulfovulcanus ferrireducens]MBT8763874.1 hydrogenase nickel incorporation protein HypB [Desulfovulcanus ferrireducens]
MQIPVVRNILEANELIAQELSRTFLQRRILALNLMSSPGAGKTTLLEKTLTDLKGEFKMAVIEGDVQTNNDAQRVAATGAQALQINTDGGCHLDSSMVLEAVNKMDLDGVDILFIENVGNLVCPAEFSVGEDYKVTILSVAEGDDKPEKYPLIFAESKVMLLNKVDLLPYVDFSLERASNIARSLNKDIEIFPVSARTGEGLDKWYDWLRQEVDKKKKR